MLALGAILTGACTSMYPAEVTESRDDDLRLCASRSRTVAIPACERVLARPDVERWPGSVSYAATAYWARAISAWHLARHLAADGRHEEALATALRSIELFDRYDVERRQKSSSEFVFKPDQQTAMLQAFLARAEYAAGLELVRLRRWREAMPHLQRVVGLDRQLPVAWATLGVVANQTEDYATSTRAFERALDIEPGYFTEPRSIQRGVFDASRDGRRFELGAARASASEP